jgi:uncharacterized membrane protein
VTQPAERDLGALELTIGRVLRVGIATSSICLAVGLGLTLIGQAGSLARVALSSGLIILLATPVARVIVSVVEYIRERDWLFVALTLTVLLALLASVVAAFWG